MIAVDTNILLYAHRDLFPQHAAARGALHELATGAALWALPSMVLTAFVRVATSAHVLTPPSSWTVAIAAVDALLESPTVRVLRPGPEHWALLKSAIEEVGATGPLVPDAEIVAVCRQHGVRDLLSEDRDFRRFDGLRLRTLDPS